MGMNVPLNALPCQHGTLFTDQTSVSIHWNCCPFCPLCFQSSSIICVHERLLGWRAPRQTPAALQCRAITRTLPSIRTEVPNTLNLQCLQTGAKVTTILSGKPQGTGDMHSVSTTQAPFVERRSEADWLQLP